MIENSGIVLAFSRQRESHTMRNACVSRFSPTLIISTSETLISPKSLLLIISSKIPSTSSIWLTDKCIFCFSKVENPLNWTISPSLNAWAPAVDNKRFEFVLKLTGRDNKAPANSSRCIVSQAQDR